jgi:flagellar basal-body rod protein FlgB
MRELKTDGLSKNELVYDLLKKSLDASSLRSKVIANNIANLNTQGFKRSYVTFEDTLKESSDNLGLETTDDKHIENGNEFGEAKVMVDESSSTRQDGNNVDIDNEMVNQASNDLMYNALISQVNTRLSVTKYIIDGGRG